MYREANSGSRFSFISGVLALDFINTAGWSRERPVADGLTDFSRLLVWAREAGVLSPAAANHLEQRADDERTASHSALEHARRVRDILHRLFSAVAAGLEPNAQTLDAFNQVLAGSLSSMQVITDDEQFRWSWSRAGDDFTSPLRPILWSAATLLLSDERRRVRSCAGHDCGWFYVDRSRNGLRRWCSMESCGSRAKARRHYRRTRALAHASDPATLPEA